VLLGCLQVLINTNAQLKLAHFLKNGLEVRIENFIFEGTAGRVANPYAISHTKLS